MRTTSIKKVPHPIHCIRSFRSVAPHTLLVAFDDGVEQRIDFRPILAGQLFGPLRDLSFFNQVQIDSDAHTLV